eukprot:COSAG01_NODE_496_length_16290_cov_48.639244_11_plen_95_part_00
MASRAHAHRRAAAPSSARSRLRPAGGLGGAGQGPTRLDWEYAAVLRPIASRAQAHRRAAAPSSARSRLRPGGLGGAGQGPTRLDREEAAVPGSM